MIWKELTTEVEWDNHKQYQWEIDWSYASENQKELRHRKWTIWFFTEFTQMPVKSEQLCVNDKETQTQKADHELT